MVVDLIKVEPGMSTKTLMPSRKVISTMRPTPLSKPIQSMANQQQQIIVIPGNMLLGSKQNGQATATMEQVKSILKLATTSSQQQSLQGKTIVTSSNNTKTLLSGTVGANKTPVVLPTLMKTTTNAAIVRPVNGAHKTAIVSPQQQLQGSPRVISLKRPYTAITSAKPEVVEPNIIKISPASHIQVNTKGYSSL